MCDRQAAPLAAPRPSHRPELLPQSFVLAVRHFADIETELIDVDDLDAAIKFAERVPGVRYGAVEIRPVQA
jgi:hypothetical protein